MGQRIGYGSIMLAVVGGVSAWDWQRGSRWASSVVLLLLVAGGLVEYVRMVRGSGRSIEAMPTIVCGTALFAWPAFGPSDAAAELVLVPIFALFLWCTVTALVRAAIAEYFDGMAHALFGVLWIAGLGSFWIPLLDRGVPMLLWLVLVTKSCDIGAYFTGSFLGRRKLIPRVSPGKTVEGSLGGLLFSVAVAVGLESAWGLGLGPLLAGVLGLLLAVVTMIGDLAESLVKRRLEVKDSASLIPAFGGILDLIDSLLYTAPVAVVGLELLGR